MARHGRAPSRLRWKLDLRGPLQTDRPRELRARFARHVGDPDRVDDGELCGRIGRRRELEQEGVATDIDEVEAVVAAEEVAGAGLRGQRVEIRSWAARPFDANLGDEMDGVVAVDRERRRLDDGERIVLAVVVDEGGRAGRVRVAD